MDIWLEDPRCGDMVLERDTGLVSRYLPDGEVERLGWIGDADNAPFDRMDEWTQLYIWWVEAGEYGRACEAEVHRSWYERLSIRGMN